MIYRFADPAFLFLLLLVPLAAWWYVRRRGREAAIQYSNVDAIKRSDIRRTGRWRHLVFVARILALAALIVAFARPQSGVTEETITTQGIDIVLALDLSTSMLAEDLSPTRIEAAKQVAADFIQGRRNDRIGLVVFAGEAFTQAPLTLDYDVVTTILRDMEPGIIEDGTAIGMGMATAVKRLQDSDAESRVIVLLTDGRNNRGEIDPATAAQMAQALGIKIYTIGAGSRGVTRIRVDDPVLGQRVVPMRVDIDEDVLREVATRTGGQYFRATDRESLEEIYREIDELETTDIEVEHFTRYGELFHVPLGLGLGLIVLELVMAHTVWRRIP
jgi:Ca-activated chloride channel family protein